MKTEHLNLAIFYVSGLVFVLQMVGYLSPAWFVQEVKALHHNKGFHVDGRHFRLPIPGMDPMPENNNMSPMPEDSDMIGDTGGQRERGKREIPKPEKWNIKSITTMASVKNDFNTDEDIDERENLPDQPNTFPSMPGNNDNVGEDTDPVTLRPARPPHSNDDNTENTDKDEREQQPKHSNTLPSMPGNSDTGGEDTRPALFGPPGTNDNNENTDEDKDEREQQPKHSNTLPSMPGNSDTGGEDTRPALFGPPGTPDSTNENNDNTDESSSGNGIDERLRMPVATNDAQADPNTGMADKQEKQKPSSKMPVKKTHIYLSAGLWYGRLCVNSRQLADMAPKTSSEMEWCSVYVRTNGSTLDNIENMFEFRLEASIGIGFSILSFLVACLCCCCHRHQGTRMIISLGAMFVSGAVMAVPVVHTLCRHVSSHDNLVRKRNWMHMFVNTHKTHDLFDHWSVILCAVACIISIISVLTFSILACKSDKEPSNWYKLNHHVSNEAKKGEQHHELPDNWMCNNKVFGSPGVTVVDEMREDARISTINPYTEMPEDVCSTFVRDGGGSIKSKDDNGETNKVFEDDNDEGDDEMSVTESGY